MARYEILLSVQKQSAHCQLKNLFPVQIENALTAHDSIREAAVVSVPDPKYGEVVGAWIIRETGKDVIEREEVRMSVAQTMNPQVSVLFLRGKLDEIFSIIPPLW